MADVKTLMAKLDISEAEAQEVIDADKRIDKGEKLFELPKELQAGAKKARQADRKPTVYNFSTRQRKEDSDKRAIINLLFKTIGLQDECKNIGITNAEREIEFVWNGRKLKSVLSAPRS